MSRKFEYKSALAPYMNSFVALKEARGFNNLREKWILNEIDMFANDHGLTEPVITEELIEAWKATRLNDCPCTLYAKYSVWSQLAKYMNANGCKCFVTRLPRHACSKSSFQPYIFTDDEISRILAECDRQRMYDAHMNLTMFAMPCLVRVLFSTGARIAEILSIRNRDVHLDKGFVLLRKTKNGKERVVPVCKSLKAVMEQYEKYRAMLPVNGASHPEAYYFVKLDGTPLTAATVLARFKSIYKKCGIKYMGNHHGPRVHDARHTWACHALRQMVANGMDVYAGLPILSVCLGHASISATEKYVRLMITEFPEIEEQCSDANRVVFQRLKDEVNENKY